MTRDASDWPEVKRELLELLELAPAAARERLQEIARERPQRAAELEALLRDAADPAAFLAVPALERAAAAPAPAPPERVGPWRLEREIGHGGMGTVWRARRDDGAFEQVVAVKLVRPELATDLLRRRLVAERRLLAGLQHEGIARLLDGGVTAEGVPYLVLEHVDGEPIDAWCDRRRLPLAQRLRLFLQVCAAVELAHRKLVLHRDIKASNVLVDEHGRPKLLDFGIAKLLGPDSADPAEALTMGLERPLTPEWASPEQLRGEPLGTTSDVYSLGVLLCLLLTGERPHRWSGQSPEELARQIEESSGGPLTGLARRRAAPGVERRALRGDLDRVLARALAAEPERRYGSVAEMAADVERFLDGRPVSAHPASALYRLRKFVRRHRAAVIAATVVIVSLIAATAVSVWQARIAEVERQRAERRFAEVRQLATHFLFDIEEEIRHLPGATTARERLAREARDTLDRLAGEAGDNSGLLAELAQAYLRIGDLEGHPQMPNLGHAGRAEASYERGRALLSRVLAVEPGQVQARVLLATAEVRLGDLASDAGKVDVAAARYRAALAAGDAALRAEPRHVAARRMRGQTLQRLGSVELSRGATAEAMALFTRARDEAAALVADGPVTVDIRRDFFVAAVYLGDGWQESGQPARALPAYAEALALVEQRRRDTPGIESERDWSVVLQRLVVALRALGRHREALAHAQAGAEFAERAAAADPANALLRRDLAEGLVDLGREQGAVGRAIDAAASCARARRLFEELSRAAPESAQLRRNLASSLHHEGEALLAARRAGEAERVVARAVELEELLLRSQPDAADLPRDAAATRRLAARLALERAEGASAAAHLARAFELDGRSPAGGPPTAGRDLALAADFFWRGATHALAADAAAACADYRRADDLAAGAEAALESAALPLARLRGAAAACRAAR